MYYAKVIAADTSAFGTGKYTISVNAGTGADPTVSLPNTQTANGDPINVGGGLPVQAVSDEWHAGNNDDDHHGDDGKADNKEKRKDDAHERRGPRFSDAQREVWQALGDADDVLPGPFSKPRRRK